MTTEEIFKIYNEQIKEALTDLKTPGRRHKQIPNLLTLGRMLSPLVIIPSALTGRQEEAIKLSLFFGLTDLADGFIARNWNLTSKLGADLDALTDKIFAGTLLLTGSISNPILLTNTGLEMLIAGVNLRQKFSGKKSGSTIMGKIKTGSVFALGGLGVIAGQNQELNKFVIPLSVATTVLQTMTLASYVKKYNDGSTAEELTSNETLEQLKKESLFWHQELENQNKPSSDNNKQASSSPQKIKK